MGLGNLIGCEDMAILVRIAHNWNNGILDLDAIHLFDKATIILKKGMVIEAVIVIQ